jgi:hypothetical protein
MPVPEGFDKTNMFADDFEQEDHESVSRLQALAARNKRDRAQDAQQRLNEKAQCAVCGSTWFSEETYNQYQANTYGSSPGSDLQALSPMPMIIKVCLCGMPQRPNLGGAVHGGRTPNENLASFDGSLDAAVGFRTYKTDEKMTLVARNLISQALGAMASADEIRTITSKLLQLEGQIAGQPASEAPASEPEAEPVRPTNNKKK